MKRFTEAFNAVLDKISRQKPGSIRYRVDNGKKSLKKIKKVGKLNAKQLDLNFFSY